jgi:hypothetical protein
MTTATIKLFLTHGDPKRLRTAEISNWTGKAVSAPRTELEQLLIRPELAKPGVYILTGRDPETDALMAYIGEAEVIRERMKHHTSRDFWVQAIAFVSKDENLTKAHIRYLEGRLIDEAQAIGRVKLANVQSSGAKLPESDTADMEVFLARIRQLLPVLGSDLLTPLRKPSTPPNASHDEPETLYHTIKGLHAEGMRTPNGFVVFEGAQAVAEERPSAPTSHGFIVETRDELKEAGTLVPDEDHLRLVRDTEFSSPSTAAGVLQGGGANGLTSWRDAQGRTLKEIERRETRG